MGVLETLDQERARAAERKRALQDSLRQVSARNLPRRREIGTAIQAVDRELHDLREARKREIARRARVDSQIPENATVIDVLRALVATVERAKFANATDRDWAVLQVAQDITRTPEGTRVIWSGGRPIVVTPRT